MHAQTKPTDEWSRGTVNRYTKGGLVLANARPFNEELLRLPPVFSRAPRGLYSAFAGVACSTQPPQSTARVFA